MALRPRSLLAKRLFIRSCTYPCPIADWSAACSL
jgi:hypothetical protein